jgi:hypothetical protein
MKPKQPKLKPKPNKYSWMEMKQSPEVMRITKNRHKKKIQGIVANRVNSLGSLTEYNIIIQRNILISINPLTVRLPGRQGSH